MDCLCVVGPSGKIAHILIDIRQCDGIAQREGYALGLLAPAESLLVFSAKPFTLSFQKNIVDRVQRRSLTVLAI